VQVEQADQADDPHGAPHRSPQTLRQPKAGMRDTLVQWDLFSQGGLALSSDDEIAGREKLSLRWKFAMHATSLECCDLIRYDNFRFAPRRWFPLVQRSPQHAAADTRYCSRWWIRFQNLHWHDLRYTFGTRLAEAGCSEPTIAGLMGHSDPQTTRRYTNATDRAKRAAV
jgi:integrase